MASPAGTYYMDGMDIFSMFGIFVEDGSDGFLRFPPSKEKYTHNWLDQHGIDTDLTRVFVGEKEITLNMCIVASSADQFFANKDAFLAHLLKPGYRRFQVTEFGSKGEFYVYYKECPDFTRYTRIQDTNLIGCKFKLVLVEAEPEVVKLSGIYLADNEGRLLST